MHVIIHVRIQIPVELLQNPVELLQNPVELLQNPVELLAFKPCIHILNKSIKANKIHLGCRR